VGLRYTFVQSALEITLKCKGDGLDVQHVIYAKPRVNDGINKVLYLSFIRRGAVGSDMSAR